MTKPLWEYAGDLRDRVPNTRGRDTRAWLALAVVVLMSMSVAAPALADATDDFVYGDSARTPNPRIDVGTLTVDDHPMSKGSSHEAMAGYYNDEGEWVSDPVFTVNTTSDNTIPDNVNHYSFKPGWIEDDSYGAFPDKANRNILNASRWEIIYSSANVTVSNTTVTGGVDALRVDTGTNGDSASSSATNVTRIRYDFWDGELDSDESKRVFQISTDVDNLDSDTTVHVNISDETGDTKKFTLNSTYDTADGGNQTNIANASGDSFVTQVKLNEITTNGGGSWDNIEAVEIAVYGGDVDMSITWLDLRKKDKNVLAKIKADDNSDTDSDLDQTNTTYNASGKISTHDMGTLDVEYDDAVIHDVEFPAQFRAQDLKVEGTEEDYRFTFEDAADFPSFDRILNVSYRLELPGAIDLSYSTTELEMEQQWPDNRYETLGINEGMDGDNLTSVSYTDKTGSLGSKDDFVTLDSTISSATEYGVKFELTLTQAEADAMKASEGEAGAVAPPQQEKPGLLENPIVWLMGVLGGLIQFVRKGFPFNRL